MDPKDLLRHYVSGAIERGEAQPIEEVRRVDAWTDLRPGWPSVKYDCPHCAKSRELSPAIWDRNRANQNTMRCLSCDGLYRLPVPSTLKAL